MVACIHVLASFNAASLNAELLLDVIINDIVFITAFIQYRYIVG